MDTWKILLIIGILLVILYFYRKNILINEKMSDDKEYYNRINQKAEQLNKYPIDIDIKQYNNYFNVKTNRILMSALDLINREISYPVIFNPSLKPVNTTNEIENSSQIDSIINYLEQIFNSFDNSWQLSNIKVKKLYKHLTEQQLKYDILLSGNIDIIENNNNLSKPVEIYMEVIITKFTSGEVDPSFDMFFNTLVLSNMDHLQYLSGLEKQINLDIINKSKNDILDNKKTANEKEVPGLTNNFDPKYPEYSIYETFVPANSTDKFSDYENLVRTEDILDIFQ